MPKTNTYGVTRRGDRWQALPYVPGRGKKVYAGTHDTREEATKAALAKIEEEQRLPANRETIASFTQRWLKDFPRPKQSTMDRYAAASQRLAGAYGNRKLHEIDKPTARSWAQSHPHDHAALRTMYADAIREGLVLSNPFSELRINIGRGRKEIIVVTPEELQAIAQVAERVHGDFGPTFRSIVIFGAYTGLRPGEIFGLDWPDVDFDAEQLYIRRQFHKRRLTLPKSGKPRTTFLPPPAAEALRSMPRNMRADHVFSGREGQRISQSALSNYWKPVRAAFEASLPERRLVDFQREKRSLDFYSVTRHYCATTLIEQGVESWIVARQLGHEDGGRLVESTYGHPSDLVARDKLRKAFQRNVSPLKAVEGGKEATG